MDYLLIAFICLSTITCIILPSIIVIREQNAAFPVVIILTGIWLTIISGSLKIATKHRKPIYL